MFHNARSSLHYTLYPRASLLFSKVSPFLSFCYLRSFRSKLFLYLNQNAFLHETFSSFPHSCPRRRPASASCERLVRSLYSRQMLLGSACRVWRLRVGKHSQSAYLYQAHRFSEPFADIIYLHMHSGAPSVRFRTLPLPLVGKL